MLNLRPTEEEYKKYTLKELQDLGRKLNVSIMPTKRKMWDKLIYSSSSDEIIRKEREINSFPIIEDDNIFYAVLPENIYLTSLSPNKFKLSKNKKENSIKLREPMRCLLINNKQNIEKISLFFQNFIIYGYLKNSVNQAIRELKFVADYNTDEEKDFNYIYSIEKCLVKNLKQIFSHIDGFIKKERNKIFVYPFQMKTNIL